jgi:hypothetical protein
LFQKRALFKFAECLREFGVRIHDDRALTRRSGSVGSGADRWQRDGGPVAITSVLWNGGEGYDLHVFPGAPLQPLDALLVVTAGGTSHFANALPAGITVQFIGEFAGAPSAHGVQVGATTGGINVANPRPDDRLNNFLIRAEVKEGGVVFPVKPRIRIHVHDKIVFGGVWLTPDTLSIHRGADGQRFSVLAQFDDDVIGDISRLPGITWQSSDSTKIAVDPNTGALSAKVDSGNQTITATLPAPLVSLNLKATAKALPTWATAATATHVSGPGVAALADVPNFLFIAEGFDKSDKDAFSDMVKKVVAFLGRDERTSPFKHLKKKINYWMTYIESPVKAASVLHEVHSYNRGTQLVGAEIPLALEPAPPPAPPAVPKLWSLQELIHEVGLPIPSEAIPPGSGEFVVDALFFFRSAAWLTLFGNKVTGRVDVNLFRSWADLADRHLIEERDSALGLAVGSRPNHENPRASRGVGWHPFRTNRAHLDGFLTLLKDAKTGTVIGHTWGAALPIGKDRPFVFALVAGTRNSGMQTPFELIASALDESPEVKLKTATLRRVTIDPYKIPKQPSLDTTTTVAHEASHSFDLGDEYGQVGRIPAAQVAAQAANLNLQDEASLLAAPQPPTITGLDGNKLKWLWPRIAKAGVLRDKPTPSGAGFEIPIEAQPDVPFKEGEVVQVRRRPLTAGIVPSDLLKISVGGVHPDKLVVETLGPLVITPTTFPKGSVVYAPVIDLPPVGTGKPLMLVHEKVRDHITAKGLPLNAPQTATLNRSCGDEGPAPLEAQKGTNLPLTLILPKGGFSHWIVGAFEGGGEFQCGLYHPTGACLMRTLIYDETSIIIFVGTGTSKITHDQLVFLMCPVCRYILVDKLDPTQHAEVEKFYSGRYPG